jgi:hypothetical protein
MIISNSKRHKQQQQHSEIREETNNQRPQTITLHLESLNELVKTRGVKMDGLDEFGLDWIANGWIKIIH